MHLNVLMIDGHNAPDRLSAALLDAYAAGLPADAVVTRVQVCDLAFEPDLAGGYAALPDWEPDVLMLADAVDACDHLVIAFPLWWGAEPARTKGLFDRLLMPGYAFRYHREDVWWDKLLAGRSADVIVTMDTPPLYLRLAYGDPVGKRWKKQILEFCGFAPVRIFRFGMVRRGGAEKGLGKWVATLQRAAGSIGGLKRGEKRLQPPAGERRKTTGLAVAERG